VRPPGLSPGFIPPPAVAVFTCRFPVFSRPYQLPRPSSSVPNCQTAHPCNDYPIIRPREIWGLRTPHESWKAGADYIGISGFAATGGLFELRKLKDHAAQDDFRDSVRHHGAFYDGEERFLGPKPTRDPLCFTFLQR